MSNGTNREYLDMTIFVEGTDGKKRPVKIGYAYKNDKGDLAFNLTSMPMPGARTDFSGLIQRREARDGAQAQGGNGGGRRGPAQQDDDSDIPF